jgi:hypothetical protein
MLVVAGHMREMRCVKFWLENLKGRHLERPRHKWENNIKWTFET